MDKDRLAKRDRSLLSLILLGFAWCFLSSLDSYATIAQIPLKDIRIPADDLLLEDGTEIDSATALKMSQDKLNPIDLSTLDPRDNTVWKNNKSLAGGRVDHYGIDFDVPVSEQTVVEYINPKVNYFGIFRFVVTDEQGRLFSVYLDKKLHTTFLRRNLLRKLGYQIPAMKYLKKLKIKFPQCENDTYDDQGKPIHRFFDDEFVLKGVNRYTEASSSRWIVERDEKGCWAVFRDLAVFGTAEDIIPNMAMGVQSDFRGRRIELTSRTTRSLILPYSLLDLPESVNKFPYHVGRIDQGRLYLPHFFPFTNFVETSLDDLQWIGRKIQKLSRKDFAEIVQMAHFPQEVGELVFQKLLSRRNDLLEKIGLNVDKKFSVNHRLNAGPNVQRGLVTKQNWREDGYATEFAGEPKEGPFRNFHYYILSILQSVTLQNIVAKANSFLEVFDPSNSRAKLMEKEFNEGLDHFLETGRLLQFPISSWSSPILNGSLIASRDVVLGNYLGTDNLVQLADTFGYSIDPGVVLGVENVDFYDDVILQGGLSYSKTFTHLKPLADAKQVFKEKYKNIIVPLLKGSLRKDLKMGFDKVDAEHILKTLRENLGVGESLLITERLSPRIGGSYSYPLMGGTVGVSLSGSRLGTRRLQIYRADDNTIQIYDDHGHLYSGSFYMDYENVIPIVRFQNQRERGQYHVKMYKVDIQYQKTSNGKLIVNPEFYDNILAISSVLKNNSTEVLEDRFAATKITGQFADRISNFSLLFLKRKGVKGFTDYQAVAPNQVTGHYLSYRESEKWGLNWESFAKDIIQTKLRERFRDFTWANNVFGHPDESLGGHGKSFESSYEVQIYDSSNEIGKEFISFTYRREGWSKKKKGLTRTIRKLEDKFGVTFFDPIQIDQIERLRMYEIYAKLKIYDRGVKRLKNLTKHRLVQLSAELGPKICSPESVRVHTLMINGKEEQIATCGYLAGLIQNKNRCDGLEDQRGRKPFRWRKLQAKCWLKYSKKLFRKVGFRHFANLIGASNFHIGSAANGFRKNSELLRQPIESNGYGRRDPRYPRGIINEVQRKLNLNPGEFNGYWLRERPW